MAFWIMVALLGCNGGSEGEQGPPGPAGPPGEDGYWWVAEGERVAPYGSDVHIDEGGRVWRFDPVLAEASPALGFLRFQAADCTGDAYVDSEAIMPLEVFWAVHETETDLRACSADATVSVVTTASYLDVGAVCRTEDREIIGLPATSCAVDSAIGPPPTWARPLHVEG
jgi:hypothetical protein